MYHLAETVDGNCVDRAQDGMRETFRRGLFQRQVVTRAQTGIDGESDRKRHRGLLVENRNFLLAIVFLENEILLLEPANRSAPRVGHSHEYIDQIDVNPERGRRFGLLLRVARILLWPILWDRALLRP